MSLNVIGKCYQHCRNGKITCAVVNPTVVMIHLRNNNFFLLVQLVEHGYTIANSSSTYTGYPASRAVDGNVSQHVSRCSHTNDRYGIKEAWLRVDLMKTFSIKSVKIWYRNDSK